MFKWFQQWRHDRTVHKIVYLSCDIMLDRARLKADMDEADELALTKDYAAFLTASEDRLRAFVDNPSRMISLFLTDRFGSA